MILKKYPRTPHLPWSESKTDDDLINFDVSVFENKNIVITQKMDGENTTMTSGHIHARSLDSKDHASRHYVKSIWSQIKDSVPNNIRICGENLFAKHSIFYDNLESYFLVFGIFEERNNIWYCLNWNQAKKFCENLNLKTVPIFYEGPWHKNLFKEISFNKETSEGYVIRLFDEFEENNFEKSVAKFVRKNHVQSDDHWMYQKIIKNQLRK